MAFDGQIGFVGSCADALAKKNISCRKRNGLVTKLKNLNAEIDSTLRLYIILAVKLT